MPYILPETKLDTTYLPPSQKNHIMAPSVFVLLHRDTSSTVSIVSVFLDLQDANAACLHSAQEAGVEVKPAAATDSEKKESVKPSLNKEPLRWEAPDGTSSWVERHTVTPRKNLGPGAAERPSGLKRNDSRLYINDEDDVIELADDDGHYD